MSKFFETNSIYLHANCLIFLFQQSKLQTSQNEKLNYTVWGQTELFKSKKNNFVVAKLFKLATIKHTFINDDYQIIYLKRISKKKKIVTPAGEY